MFSVFNGIRNLSVFHRYFIGLVSVFYCRPSIFYRYFIGTSNLSVIYQHCIGIESVLNRYLSLPYQYWFTVIHDRSPQVMNLQTPLALSLFPREDRSGRLLSMRCLIPARLDEDVVPARIGRSRRGPKAMLAVLSVIHVNVGRS